MADRVVTSERRSEISVGQKDAGAEVKVRRALRLPGRRIRRRELPGLPDIVFPPRRETAFVHGCFRHGCRLGRLPKSDCRASKAAAKRDERNVAALRDGAGSPLRHLRGLDGRRIVEFLDGAGRDGLRAVPVEP